MIFSKTRAQAASSDGDIGCRVSMQRFVRSERMRMARVQLLCLLPASEQCVRERSGRDAWLLRRMDRLIGCRRTPTAGLWRRDGHGSLRAPMRPMQRAETM